MTTLRRQVECNTRVPSYHAAAAAQSLQSCPTLCDPIDGSPPGSPVPGILKARTLEWVAISFSNVWKWKVKVKLFTYVRLSATPWTEAYQAPPFMGFSRQEIWSGVPLSSPSYQTLVQFDSCMMVLSVLSVSLGKISRDRMLGCHHWGIQSSMPYSRNSVKRIS